MKYFLALLMTLFTVCCAASPKRDDYYANVDYVGHETSVRILATCSDGSKGLGSGVIVGKDTVLTALHVTTCDIAIGPFSISEPAMEVVIIDFRGKEYKVINEVSNSDIDITRLVVDGAPFKLIAYTQARVPKIGETVCWYGGDGFKSNRGVKKCGYYEGTKDVSGETFHFVSGKASPGNSGSGVFDLSGNLIGILNVGQWNSNYDFGMGFTLIDKAPLLRKGAK